MVHFSKALSCISALSILYGALSKGPLFVSQLIQHFVRGNFIGQMLVFQLNCFLYSWAFSMALSGDCRSHSKILAVPESIKKLHHRFRMVRISHQTQSTGSVGQMNGDSEEQLVQFLMGMTHHQEVPFERNKHIYHEFKIIYFAEVRTKFHLGSKYCRYGVKHYIINNHSLNYR